MPIEETLKDLKDLAAQQKQLQNAHQSGVCPSCGYCPHCGRGQQMQPLYPSYPYHPSPWWQVQPWYGPTWTVTGLVTAGTSPISGNVSSLTNAALVQGHISYTSGTCSPS